MTVLSCEWWDITCTAQEGIISLVAMFVIPILVLLVAIFLLPRFGKKGAILGLLIVIVTILWYVGLPGILPPLRGMF